MVRSTALRLLSLVQAAMFGAWSMDKVAAWRQKPGLFFLYLMQVRLRWLAPTPDIARIESQLPSPPYLT